MAGPFYVDAAKTGGANTGGSWTDAFLSIYSVPTLASGEIVYVAHNHAEAAPGAAKTITGPTSGLPALIISVTQDSNPVAYAAGSATNQVNTAGGAYRITFDGSFQLEGLVINSGQDIYLTADGDEQILARNCIFKPAATKTTYLYAVSAINCTFSGANDTGATGGEFINCSSGSRIVGGSCVSVTNRTGYMIRNGAAFVDGLDISGFTNATLCELFGNNAYASTMTNCLTAATWAPFATPTLYTLPEISTIFLTNVGPADAPTYLYLKSYAGDCVSTASIYRSGGATIEGDACSWLITTTATCGEGAPFYTPWIYGTVSSTGSKTFDLYITNDTADFDDSMVWLDCEVLSTADEAIWALATDQRATITTTAAAQTDDTTSTWNGTGPSFTYKQKLSVTATVNETGQYRARVAVGVASIAGSRYFYVDPKVTVS